MTYSSIPPNGIGFDPREAFYLSFNADLGTELATPGLLEFTDGTTVVPATVTVAGQGLMVVPAAPLKLRTDYKFTLRAGFAGTSSVLANDYVLSFKTDVVVFDIKQAVPYNPKVGGTPFIAAADFSGDGRPDIVELGELQNVPADAPAFTEGYTLILYAQGSDGNFSKYQQIDFTRGQSVDSLVLASIVLLDIDGDSVPEILVPEHKSLGNPDGGLRVFSRGSDGKFEVSAFIPTSYLQILRVDDVDGDGRPDLVGSASTVYTGGFQVLINEGFKSSSAPTGLRPMAAVATPPGIGEAVPTSLNRDGNRQLVFQQATSSSPGNFDGRRIDVYSQVTRGVFSFDPTLSRLFDGVCAVEATQCGRMTVLDIDADGLPDFIFGGDVWTATSYLRRGASFVKGFAENFRAFPYVTDVDGDGVEDLIFVANQDQPFVAAAVGTRSDTLLFSTVYPVPLFNDINYRAAAVIVDLNGDGLPDVVIDQINSGIYVAIQHKY